MATTHVEKAQKQVILPIGKDAGWLDARELVRTKGGLPSNALHDDVLVRSDDWKQLKGTGYYAAWAREVLVYPGQNGMFEKGHDVVDASKDDKGREWVFPASQIPEVAIGQSKVGLFVDPQNIEVNDKRVVILAESKSVVVLTPFIQNNGEVGKVHEATRVPLYVDEALRDQLTEQEKRWLYRINGAGVRPLARYLDVGYDYGRSVGANDGPDSWFGVASFGLEEAAPPVVASNTAQFKALLRDAKENLAELSETVRTEKLERLQKLVRALEIKG